MTDFRRAESLGYQVNLLARLLERALRDEIAPHGVVPGQFPALLCLYEEDGLTQSEIADRVRIEQPTIARTLQRMERDGLVRRAPDRTDRRRTHIHLTPRARALEGELTAAAGDVNQRALRGLTTADAGTLAQLIRRLIDNLDEGAPDGPDRPR